MADGLRGVQVVIVPNNWAELQHYKDRSPPWIKLHKKLLDNYEFQCLPVASRALAPMLWLLASEHAQGQIDAEPQKIGFRLRMSEQEVSDAIAPLIGAKFFSPLENLASKRLARASKPQAKVERAARPETETETEIDISFAAFWDAYPRKVSRPDAKKAFEKINPDQAVLSEMLTAIRKQGLAAKCAAGESRFVAHPATWLNKERWKDEDSADMWAGSREVAL
jgi:hypothetical protein